MRVLNESDLEHILLGPRSFGFDCDYLSLEEK